VRSLPLGAIALAVLALATGCERGGDATAAPATAAPASAAPGAAEAPAAARLVVVGGAVTEIVFALGAGDRVVGVDTSSQYPAVTAKLPKVGYQRQLAAEGVLGLGPTKVLLTEAAGPPEAIAQLAQAGVATVTIPGADSIEGAAARIRAVGAAIGEAEAAEALAADVARRAEAARDRAATRAPRPEALFLYARGPGTLFVGGAGSSAASMLALAGADNAGAALEGFAPLTAESASAAAPDVIVVPTKGLASLGGVDGVLRQPGLAETPAGAAKRVVAVDDLLTLGFGPRLPEAIDHVADALHGGAAAAVSPK
jgi:iron complex transport system substrate-binding protein